MILFVFGVEAMEEKTVQDIARKLDVLNHFKERGNFFKPAIA